MSFSSSFQIITALLFLGLSMWMAFLGARGALARDRRVTRRLAGGGGVDIGASSTSGAKAQEKRNLLTQLGAHLTLPGPEEITRLRFLLSQAGYYDAAAVKTYFGARVVCLFTPLLLVLMSWAALWSEMGMGSVLIGMGACVIGLMAPEWFVRWKKSQRTDQCRRGFPDMMDLLVACIEAGLAMDAALIRVAQEIGNRYPVLKTNLEIMNLELRAGRQRHDAMIQFAERIDLEEAKALAVMLKQAEEMGSSVGEALRTFSDDMRNKRMMRAEEKAMALAAKLTVPLILFIFPTILVMLLVPAGIRLVQGLAQV